MAGFKAIIIGGGPSGLAMAHALTLAGIDYVLYERRPTIADKEGAGIVLMPNAMRLLHQFGILEKAQAISFPVKTTTHLTGDGGKGWRDDPLGQIGEKFGYGALLFERYQLMKLLLETLPHHERRVRTGRSFKSIQEHENGVVVTFDDDSIEEGSIVIGADGVHSDVRRYMSETSAGKIEAMPFTTHSWGLYGHGARPEGLRVSETVEKHYDGWAFQTFSGKDRTFYFIYSMLDKPTKARRRFAKDDLLKFVEPRLDQKVFGDVTFADIWNRRDFANLRSLEQGVAKQWSHGRVVLLGDAVHKVTPNIGLGGNMGIESAACLANHLHALVKTSEVPNGDQLTKAFDAYQKQRFVAVNFLCRLGFAMLKYLTFENEQMKDLFEQRAEPSDLDNIGVPMFSDNYLRTFSHSVKLDYVPLESELVGTHPWGDASESAPRSKL